MSRRITVRCPDELLSWLKEFGGDEAAALRALATIGAAALGFASAARPALAEAARHADGRFLALLVELAARESHGSTLSVTRQPQSSLVADAEQPDDGAVAAIQQPGGSVVAVAALPEGGLVTAVEQPQGLEAETMLELEEDPLAGIGFTV